MKVKCILLALTAILVISIIYCCNNSNNQIPVLLNDIYSIEINPYSNNKVIYTKEKNSKEIEEFFIAYKEAKLTDNGLATTHNNSVEIKLYSGDKITVFGGSQGFQTVEANNKQFNIKGDKLWNYFKNLNDKFKE